MASNNEWITAQEAWAEFVRQHPELGYHAGRWQFHNFLRFFREHLRNADAIRLAKRKHWIARRVRFVEEAFACATGMIRAAATPDAA